MVFVPLFFVQCDQDSCDVIPDVRVEFTINMYTPPYNTLQAVGNSLEIPVNKSLYAGGYNNNGVIVHRRLIDEFQAYDRTCTFNHGGSVAVEISKDNPLIAICPECDSKFYLSSGGIPSDDSKAPCPLKNYNADFYEAVNEVSVYNY